MLPRKKKTFLLLQAANRCIGTVYNILSVYIILKPWKWHDRRKRHEKADIWIPRAPSGHCEVAHISKTLSVASRLCWEGTPTYSEKERLVDCNRLSPIISRVGYFISISGLSIYTHCFSKVPDKAPVEKGRPVLKHHRSTLHSAN